LTLIQWYLEPRDLSGFFTQIDFVDEFDGVTLKPEWEWVDLEGNSSYNLSSKDSWLELNTASVEGLYLTSFTAPCFLQRVAGDFAAEIKLKAASDDLPSVGGILIWKDEKNCIRFEKGLYGKDYIRLSCYADGRRDSFGRGMLVSEIVYLRMERIGNRFSAYCSSDGQDWMTCGEVNFLTEDPIQVGLHSIGSFRIQQESIETATLFDYFRILKKIA